MTSKKRLSKNLLQMKFMKRTKEKQEREQDHEEQQTLFRSEITEAMRTQGNKFIVEPSYVGIEQLGFGRLSFNGMNPEIERLMEQERLRQEEKGQEKAEKEVTDKEMANHFGNLEGTIARKFASKRSYKQSRLEDGPALLEQGAAIMDKIHQSRDVLPATKKRKFKKPRD